ncbi:MAG: NADP-dependent isocitrate dehydrogenase [Pseudomonadota bacterium]|jgi:isocitrate dehydrogenase|nr:NADP-dependent isocitrate dehydrogenase [Pseudomonadota bacterium]MED5421820.1 NADP-dependent isocitrate dehydrogenase [Pseudomonadota bacterium]
MKTPITVARGDGIGPEIMDATLRVLEAAGAQLDIEEIEIGEAVYKRGVQNGIEDSAWDSLRRTKVFLKAPITTPQGGGFKSLNVTVRKSLGLYANVRPCVSYHPYVETNFPGMDIVIVRENEEDLYAGIEHRQTQDVVQAIKVISRPGCERIVRYAFEYARANGRKKVTCMSKDNIMKMADGLFHKTFDEIGLEYPDIEQDHYIIDIGTARIAARPDDFDVIVTENLYGDIISDVAVEITGSVGLGGSCNVGDDFAMFEAVHGSAPDISGKGIANPSGLLLGAVLMLNHIGQSAVATKIHNAWYKTLEDGVHTGDIYDENLSKERVGTVAFADAVIARLGQNPSQFKPVDYGEGSSEGLKLPPLKPRRVQKKELFGADIFVAFDGATDELVKKIHAVDGLKLEIISNRGVKVWPNGHPDTFCSDHWCLRFYKNEDITHDTLLAQLKAIKDAGVEFIKVENLYEFDGERGFTLAQGQ